MMNPIPSYAGVRAGLLTLAAALFLPGVGQAVEMQNDPMGYSGIPWGASLVTSSDLKLVKTTDRLSEFSPKNGLTQLGDAKVESMTFICIDEQFARVTIRYKGAATHHQILTYLQNLYGPLDRTPGSMMRGMNQQFDWRGDETEVNVVYESIRDRGFVFIESRLLSAKFNEGLSETAY